MPPDPLASALARISRIVAESLELKEVFARVAETAATVLPFDMMGMGRLEAQDVWSVYAVVGDLKGTPQGFNPDDFSPELRIRPGTIVRIEDAERTLDRRFAYDALILDSGYRSGLRAPLLRRDQLSGAVSVWSRRADAFTEDHVEALRPISSLLGLALEHERLHNLDLLRRRRLEALDALIPALAQALDVRAIFNRVSEIVRPVLPHDRLVLTTLDPDRREVTVDAISGEPLSGFPTTIPAGEGDLSLPGKEYLLFSDVEAEPSLSAEQRRRCQTHTTRSILKIPLRLDGRLSTLGFASRTPHQYSDEDVVVARRVADHVSLLMSHQRLAEEERRGAEARQRAARLEEHVEALRNELETTRGPRQVIGESKAWKEVLTYAAKVAPTETTVLLTGESGTGKEVVARLIHRGSPRAKGPFVAINCAALPDTLLESELFGHEKGAFTGAAVARPGRIEQAERGVLFLDEVGEMSPAVQAKFLRVLQEREYQRLGGARTFKADVRV
ncbi:MAG TPA: sigma 54-interacting transcriptional regulator, partial [Dongiaceae bacterium]|nr:sigma 54-interacting transcriptional regulator [Dongiaceae bacterium]